MSIFSAIIATILSPFFVDFAPEVRTTYVSLGKIVEDRPMQVTSLCGGYDAGALGRFGIRNWDVSSLTGRRSDVHRHALYHTEFGPIWQHKYDFTEDSSWRLSTDITRSWTLYRGFNRRHESSNRTYQWWQIEQYLGNPYLVPFYRLRRTFRGTDYLYFKAGVRRRFPIIDRLSVTPSVFAEGGSARNLRRTLGRNIDGTGWGGGGVASASARLELGWSISSWIMAFAYVEQYGIVGGDARRTVGASKAREAHRDWTHGGVGMRMHF